MDACRRGPLERPFGYHRLGPVVEFLKPETIVSEHRLIIRYKDGGLSAMSTLCTHDLTPLHRKSTPEGLRWLSNYTKSSYTDDGRVVTGPAEFPLPYYELEISPGRYGGPADTLYVRVGINTDSSWSLPVK